MTIACKTRNGQYIGDRDAIIQIDGITYPATIQLSDAGDGYIVTLHKARHIAEAYIKPATDSDMELLLPAMLAGIVYQQVIVDVAASLPVDAVACTTLATAAAELERKAAPAAIRDGMPLDATAAQIAAAADKLRADRKARHATRDARRAANAPQEVDEIVGDGWTIRFDGQLQRTRLIFDAWPGKHAIAAAKAAGFAWIATAREWRRGYNATARKAAQELAATLAM